MPVRQRSKLPESLRHIIYLLEMWKGAHMARVPASQSQGAWSIRGSQATFGASRTINHGNRNRRKARRATVAMAKMDGERRASRSPSTSDVMCSFASTPRWICPFERLAARQHHIICMHRDFTVNPPRRICPLERPATCLHDYPRIQHMQVQSMASAGWIPSGLKQCVGPLPGAQLAACSWHPLG